MNNRHRVGGIILLIVLLIILGVIGRWIARFYAAEDPTTVLDSFCGDVVPQDPENPSRDEIDRFDKGDYHEFTQKAKQDWVAWITQKNAHLHNILPLYCSSDPVVGQTGTIHLAQIFDFSVTVIGKSGHWMIDSLRLSAKTPYYVLECRNLTVPNVPLAPASPVPTPTQPPGGSFFPFALASPMPTSTVPTGRPAAGPWTGAVDHVGRLTFTVNPDGTAITEVTLEPSQPFHCCGNNLTESGGSFTSTIGGPWPIINGKVTMSGTFFLFFDHTTASGTFDETGKQVAGTWETTHCRGTWAGKSISL